MVDFHQHMVGFLTQCTFANQLKLSSEATDNLF